MAELGTIDPLDVQPIDAAAWEITGLTQDCIEPVVRETQAAIIEVERLFTVKR